MEAANPINYFNVQDKNSWVTWLIVIIVILIILFVCSSFFGLFNQQRPGPLIIAQPNQQTQPRVIYQ